jgi:hypothetical protein
VDSDDKVQWSTNDAHLMDADPGNDPVRRDDAPGGDEKSVDVGGIKDKEMWESPQEKLGSPQEESGGGSSSNQQSGSAENTSPDPQSENPATPEHQTLFDKIFTGFFHPDVAPGGDEKGAEAEGVRYSAQEMWGWESPWDPGDRDSDASSPQKSSDGGGGDHITQSENHAAAPEDESLFDKIFIGIFQDH